FYLDARKCVLHVSFRDSSLFLSPPATLESYENVRSSKIDAVVAIIQHHTKSPNRPPLNMTWEDARSISPTSYELDVSKVPDSPDKIVMYSSFPEHNQFLKACLAFYNINTLEIHGKKSAAQRAATLRQFRTSSDAVVLIVSNVGTTGLNLDCANILIIADLLWSKQDELQLIGRVWRRPQPKQVIVYRLIALDSPDQFLNNLSWGKASMHESFLGKKSVLSKSKFNVQICKT
ncbi:P-loop containing nucleoside triphosphate hydrolase protein, partial [Irpex rosettiformis]